MAAEASEPNDMDQALETSMVEDLQFLNDPNDRKRGSSRATHKAPNLFRNSRGLMGSSPSASSFGDKPSWQPRERPFHSFHSVGNVHPQSFPMPNMNPSIRTAIRHPDSNRAPLLPHPPPMLNNFGLRNQMGQGHMNNDVNTSLFSPPSTVFQPHMARNKRSPNVPTPFRPS